jgi:hypothetical protein
MHQLRMSPLRPFSGWTKIPSSLPDFFFFFPPLLYPKIFPRPTYHLPPPVLPTTYLPRPTYHLPPPSYLPPTSPLLPTTYQPHPPLLHRQNSRDLGWLWSGSWSCGCGAGTELLELERDPRAHEKVRSLLLFLACLLACYNAASSGARLRSLRCFLACLLRLACCCNAASSGAWELAVATQQTPELAATKPCNAASSGASLAVEEKKEPWTFYPILYIFYFALV